MNLNHKNGQSGFTLMEIILVVIIIGILAAMVIPNLSGKSEQARIAAAKTDIEANIATALDLYEVENGKYPTTDQGLKALIEKPSTSPEPQNWNGPYLKKKKVPVDPWGVEYTYAAPGQQNSDSYDLSSMGPDGKQSNDDITNWNTENK